MHFTLSSKSIFSLTAIAVLGLPMPAIAGDASEKPVAQASSASSWLEPYRHNHFSDLGAPIIHTFNIEPAFTGRDLFGTYRFHSKNDAIEHETELELEWGLTRRLGIIFELPYIVENERLGPTERGFGDLVVVPRALLVETDHLLLTAQAEIGLPTGSDDFGQQTTLTPGIAAWYDLGNWWTLQGLIGWENKVDEDEAALEFGLGLIKSIDLKGHGGADCDHNHRTHAGLLNFHLEFTGEMGLTDDEDGRTEVNGLVGVSHGLDCGLDIRFGYEFPVTRPAELDYGWVLGANWHF
ncbi:MAG: transporter [Akkermansiaceae bacterium]|nr:transporter [Akkermansiaceae bacterium]